MSHSMTTRSKANANAQPKSPSSVHPVTTRSQTRRRALSAAATKVFALPELCSRIVYSYAGCRTPSATAIVEATDHISDLDADDAAADAWVKGHADHGMQCSRPGMAAYRHAMAVLIYVLERDRRDWGPGNGPDGLRWREPKGTYEGLDELPAPVARLFLRNGDCDYAEMRRNHFLLGEGEVAPSSIELMRCWRPPKPCGVGLTVRYSRRKLFEIAADACPPDQQPSIHVDKAAIVRHILTH